MASSNWRTGCVREEREKELAFVNGDTRRTNDHCENLGEVDKENQGDAETQVVLVLDRAWVQNCFVSNSPSLTF